MRMALNIPLPVCRPAGRGPAARPAPARHGIGPGERAPGRTRSLRDHQAARDPTDVAAGVDGFHGPLDVVAVAARVVDRDAAAGEGDLAGLELAHALALARELEAVVADD